MVRLKSPVGLERPKKIIYYPLDPNKLCILVCAAKGCCSNASDNVAAAFEEEIKKQDLETKVEFGRTCCHAFCHIGPLVLIFPEQICYLHVKPEDVAEIISETIIGKKIIERLLFTDPCTNKKIVHEFDISIGLKSCYLSSEAERLP